MKINTFLIYKGGGWGAEEIFKKNQQKGGFSLFIFFAFLQGSLNPQNYELAPYLP